MKFSLNSKVIELEKNEVDIIKSLIPLTIMLIDFRLFYAKLLITKYYEKFKFS